MAEPLRVLLVEDVEDDALLILRELKAGGYDPACERVDNFPALRAALTGKQWDVILCDYLLPGFDGLEALALYKELDLDIPFLIVSGAIGEETAVAAIRYGAHDYIRKDNISRLCPAIRRELREAEARSRRGRAEDALRERDMHWRKLTAMVPGMIYQFTRRPDGSYCVPFTTEAIRRIFGCAPEDVREDFAPIARVLFPDDLDRVIGSIEESARRLTIWTCEYRVQIPGGPVRWMQGESAPEKLADGSITWYGFNTDITERKKTEALLQESELKYRTLVETTNDFVFMVNRRGMFTYVNPNFERATGYSLADLLDRPFTEVIAPEEREVVIDRFRKGVRGAPSIPYETVLLHKEGKRVEVEFLASNLYNGHRNVTGRFGVGRDITKRKEMEKLLRESEKRYRELSIIDDLTQLYNSRYFYDQLQMEIARANRYGQPLSLMLLDLDNFKNYNDTYGHLEGNEVLSRLGQVVKRCLRQTDSAYRYGGEEFSILLPMTTGADGVITAERVRREFKKELFLPLPGKEVQLTLSIGVAQYAPQEDLKAFVYRVDQLMYEAKRKGRDRICAAPPQDKSTMKSS